jgi:hypothetical protein
MTETWPCVPSRSSTWVTPPDTSNTPSDSKDLYCNYWMQGRGCKYFIQGRCRKLHVENLDGKDYLNLNMCHRYSRGRCGQQEFCSRLHATDGRDAKQKFLKFAETSGITQTPQRHIEPLAGAIMSAIRSTPEDEHTRFAKSVLDVFENSFALQHPRIRTYLDIVCKDIRDSLH